MKKVLIVEDHADIRRLVRLTLEFEDCVITEANNGVDGVRAAMEVCPDVVLMDVMMPGELDGLEACRRMRSAPSLAGMKIIILSARGAKEDRDRGEAAGADAYLLKPFSPLELLRVIESVSAVDVATRL